MARISGPARSHLSQHVMSDDGQGPARTIEPPRPVDTARRELPAGEEPLDSGAVRVPS